jgi:hypothetical protein
MEARGECLVIDRQLSPQVDAARRSDAGQPRFGARDIAGLVLAGDMYAVPYDLLGAGLGAHQDRLRAIVARWRRAGARRRP